MNQSTTTSPNPASPPSSTGEKAKARDILAAIRTLKQLERDRLPADEDDRVKLARFGGFGAGRALDLPRPGHRQIQGCRLGIPGRRAENPADARGIRLGQADDVFPVLHRAGRHGRDARGPGQAWSAGWRGHIGAWRRNRKLPVPRQARTALHRRRTRFDHGQDRPPAAPAGRHPHREFPRLETAPARRGDRQRPLRRHQARFQGRQALAPRFLRRQVRRLAQARRGAGRRHQPLTRWTSRTRPSASGSAEQADFLGAIRLPSDAFKQEGTAVTTDILFLRKRAPGQEPNHADPEWTQTSVLGIQGAADLPVNRYFLQPPRDGAGRLEPPGHALRDGLQRQVGRVTWPAS